MISKTERFVIGVDGGGSKTAVSLLDQNGQLLGQGLSGSSNQKNVGLEQAKANLWQGMLAAAEQAGVELLNVTAVTWSLAGVDRPKERRLFKKIATEMLPNVIIQIENDAVSGLVGGLGHRNGVVLIAGTGMIAYGENERGQKARAGGWGPFFDRGSAYDLVQSTLRAVARQYDIHNQTSPFSQELLSAVGLAAPTDFLSWMYDARRRIADIAALAPIVLSAAEAGNILALESVNRGANGLATAVAKVAQKLDISDKFQLVWSGSLLLKSDFYRQLVAQAIHTRLPNAQLNMPRENASIGAAWMALAKMGNMPPLHSNGNPPPLSANLWASERRNQLTCDVDLHSTQTIVGLMHILDKEAVASVRPHLATIASAVDDIAARMKLGGRLIYVGAGTSGRLGILDASECPPTFSTDPSQVVGIIAGGQQAITRSVEKAEDDESAGAKALLAIDIQPQDSVVGIAASGRTPFVIGALRQAKRSGALAISLTNNISAPIAEIAQHCITPLVGPEMVTGSTRMKAGTAQKLVLNMLSTAVMIRLGKTYGNLMVDVQLSNQKLQSRARRIVAQACQVDLAVADAVLQAADGSVKAAIVMMLVGCSLDEARERLEAGDGVVRTAVST